RTPPLFTLFPYTTLFRSQAIAATPMPPMPPMLPNDGIPGSVIRLVITVLVILAATIIGLPMSRAFARRMDRKTTTAPDPEVVRRSEEHTSELQSLAYLVC